ncbi:ferrous iron transport protein B [Tepiditoga spiralis]|uniref:Ferrous iron transport protein B n=1 Tax=Tepiditoga spiralis TaxID=2108365 RepID=A0A7G1G4I2_9BACT|nr:ferrous iron transport protein B [Tepiditoga spiralis]BBE31428.1 ferrous iron transport protein B [Tepiditoga spiralis]
MSKIALCGNPNSGKTSIFNALTGTRQHVGNWPGVTVEKKEGHYTYNQEKIKVVDLPGTYCLTANSIDERIARNFIVEEMPDTTIVIIDQTNIERNLYLVTEILEMRKNVILVFNMSDEAEKLGIKIDYNGLKKEFGVPIIKTIATKKEGLNELKSEIKRMEKNIKKPNKIEYSQKFEIFVQKIENELLNAGVKKGDLRWKTLKLIEGDIEIRENINSGTLTKIDLIISELQRAFKNDPGIVVSEERYKYIAKIVKKYVKRPKETIRLSDKIDKIITSKLFGLPIFAFIMWLMFQLTYSLGNIFLDMIDGWFGTFAENISAAMQTAGINSLFTSFVTDGLIGGVGSVLVFVPNIFFLFLFISFLGDIGYMSRAAFVMDRIMSSIGLNGKAFIPMVLGFGCSIPAIMATRTLESKKDRIITTLVVPFMSCSARYPVYLIFASIFFPKHAGTVIFSMYMIGIVIAIISSKIFSKKLFNEENTSFIMELPPYRLPTFTETLGEALKRTWLFIKKAGTFIFAAVIIIWIMASLPSGVEYAGENSFIGIIGKIIAPIFKPLGFGFWQVAVAILFGFLAKEVVVGTLGTLFGGEELLSNVLPQYFNAASAFSLMVFVLLYFPCIAAIGAMKREIGKKWTLFQILFSTGIAYITALIAYRIGLFFI